jgi:hypothetical protein
MRSNVPLKLVLVNPSGVALQTVDASNGVAVPIQLVLINPSGTVVQTVNSSSGVAILEAPITQSGVYIIKTVNLSLGPVQIRSVATPLVSTSLVSQVSNGPPTGPRDGTPPGGTRSSLWTKKLVEVCERVLTGTSDAVLFSLGKIWGGTL